MKDFQKIIPVTTALILYSYITGGLYFAAYWSIFNFDPSNFVSLTDIPKNFIYPLIILQGFVIAAILLGIFSSVDLEKLDEYLIKIKDTKKYKNIQLLLDFLFVILTFVLIFSYPYNKMNVLYWKCSAFALTSMVATKMAFSSSFFKLMPSFKQRMFFCFLLFSIPFLAFAIGKMRGIRLYYNVEVKYIKIIKPIKNQTIADTTSYKLLGFLGDKLIISSLDNKKIEVINQSSMDGVELIQEEKK